MGRRRRAGAGAAARALALAAALAVAAALALCGGVRGAGRMLRQAEGEAAPTAVNATSEPAAANGAAPEIPAAVPAAAGLDATAEPAATNGTDPATATVPAAAGLDTAVDPAAAASGTTMTAPAAVPAAVPATVPAAVPATVPTVATAQQASTPAPFQPYQNAEGAWIYTDNKLNSGKGGPPKGLLSEILQAFAHSRNATTAPTAPVGGTMVIRSPVDPANLFTPAQLLPLYVGQPGAGGYGSL